MKTLLIALLFVCLALAQQRIDRILIDDFERGIMNINVEVPNNPQFPIIRTISYRAQPGDNILGGERDLRLQIETAPPGVPVATAVQQGAWVTNTPRNAQAFATMQWDGIDDSIDINLSGLGPIDLTDGGLADAFRAVIATDIPTEYTFTAFSPGNRQCSFLQQIPTSLDGTEFIIAFNRFSGNCDFTQVGAIQVLAEAFANVDTELFIFAVQGVAAPPTPSNTPSPSRAPPTLSQTSTPSAIPSQSRTPTPTSTPSIAPTPPPRVCDCFCPVFTCGLIYAHPIDDDDNSDNAADIIYRPVYYGPADDDFDNAYPIRSGGTAGEVRSSSSTLVIPVLTIILLFLF